MSTKDDTPDEVPELSHSVGYGSPPKATRFKKGISGNPKGRPKGSLNVATLLLKTLHEKVVIIEHDKRKKVTKFEAVLKQLVHKAASGDPRAQRQLFELAKDAEAKQSAMEVAVEKSKPASPDLKNKSRAELIDIAIDLGIDFIKRGLEIFDRECRDDDEWVQLRKAVPRLRELHQGLAGLIEKLEKEFTPQPVLSPRRTEGRVHIYG
jgi:hypothetical protein